MLTVYLGIGLDPNTSIFEGLAAMNPNKEIIVDIDCNTNVPGFFVAGDASSKLNRSRRQLAKE